jgi:hypothetical protein
MPRREDDHTNTVEDAAAFERWRGEAYDIDDRPTKAELDREEQGAAGMVTVVCVLLLVLTLAIPALLRWAS